MSGYSGFSGSGGGGATLSYTQNVAIGMAHQSVVSKVGTVTGTAGVGSSLFLHRLFVPGPMNLTEVQNIIWIGFPATSQGQGSMSHSFAIYSFGNSTSLASLISASGSSSWTTGTVTAGGAASITQFQGGWQPSGAAAGIIHALGRLHPRGRDGICLFHLAQSARLLSAHQ